MTAATAPKSRIAMEEKMSSANHFRTVQVDASKHIIMHKKGDDRAAGLLADKIMADAEKPTTGTSSRKLLSEMSSKRS